MKLQSLLKKLNSIRASVRKRAGYDKKNVSDKVRGLKAEEVMKDSIRQVEEVLRTEDTLIEADVNKSDDDDR